MINAQVVLDYRLWKNKIKNPKTYFRKKLNKLSKFTNPKNIIILIYLLLKIDLYYIFSIYY